MAGVRIWFVVRSAGLSMKIKIDSKQIRESRWYEYVARFVFGGAITAIAGIIATRYGPGIGGLFLAFPAILPATATLIKKHETEKKEQAGKSGEVSGRRAAGVDAAGAAMGCAGLVVFGAIVWKALPGGYLPLVLLAATLGWFVTAVAVWLARETLWRKFARKVHATRHFHAATNNSSTNRRIR